MNDPKDAGFILLVGIVIAVVVWMAGVDCATCWQDREPTLRPSDAR